MKVYLHMTTGRVLNGSRSGLTKNPKPHMGFLPMQQQQQPADAPPPGHRLAGRLPSAANSLADRMPGTAAGTTAGWESERGKGKER